MDSLKALKNLHNQFGETKKALYTEIEAKIRAEVETSMREEIAKVNWILPYNVAPHQIISKWERAPECVDAYMDSLNEIRDKESFEAKIPFENFTIGIIYAGPEGYIATGPNRCVSYGGNYCWEIRFPNSEALDRAYEAGEVNYSLKD